MIPLSESERRAHPELMHLVLLEHQLSLVTDALTDAHSTESPVASRDQARSMVTVIRALSAQITAYRRLLELPPRAPARS